MSKFWIAIVSFSTKTMPHLMSDFVLIGWLTFIDHFS